MTDTRESLRSVLVGIVALEVDAKRILSSHEASTARIITLEQSYSKLSGLSLDQDETFREALRAVESGLFRASHVLAWAGFVDYFHNYLLPAHAPAVHVVQQSWMLNSPEDLREQADFQVIEAAKRAGIYSKTMMKALHGLLNKRNECAHPSSYFPDLNQTLGYMSEIFGRIEKLR